MESFSLQTYLIEMRKDAREDHAALMDKFEEIATTVNQHETRLVVVENTRKSILGLSAAMALAFIGAGIDLLFNHWKR